MTENPASALSGVVKVSPGTMALGFLGLVALVVAYHGAKVAATKVEGALKNAASNLKTVTMSNPASAGAAPAASNGGF